MNKEIHNGNFYLSEDKQRIDFILRTDYGKRKSEEWELLSLDRCVKTYYLNRDRYTTFARQKMELDILPDYVDKQREGKQRVVQHKDSGEASIGRSKFARETIDSREIPHHTLIN